MKPGKVVLLTPKQGFFAPRAVLKRRWGCEDYLHRTARETGLPCRGLQNNKTATASC